MANKHLKESSFKAGPNESKAGVAKPGSGKNSEAPVGNAANSAKPANPGGLNLLKKISSNGTFKTGHSK